MATRGASPAPDTVYHSQGDRVDDLLAQYGAVSGSQGSIGPGPATPKSGSQNLSFGMPSPQRSPHPTRPAYMVAATSSPQRSPHAHRHPKPATGPAHSSPAHSSPRHLPPSSEGGYETGGNIMSTSWANIPAALSPEEEAPAVNYPTSAAEILKLLHDHVAILSGGRDRQGQSLITFPAKPKSHTYVREDIRRVVQYLASIPTEDVREHGFSVVVDARNSTWNNTKLILRSLQEALPGQIHVVYIIQPGHFWQKTGTKRGHNKEKSRLEFSTVMLSALDKLIRHVELSQLTADVGGFLPYNHQDWIKLRLDLEHFISSFNALMEHTAHVEQQLRLEQESEDVETAEDLLARHIQLQDQLWKAPQNTIREGGEFLRQIEQGHDEAGTSSMTPDKINAVAVIRRLLDSVRRRQVQLEDLWRERKTHFEQTLQLRVFEKAMHKVRNWLKGRAEEIVATRSDIGDTLESSRAMLEQHEKFEAKARSMYNSLTQLRRMADRFAGANHFAADSLQRQVSKLSARFSKFESYLGERSSIIHGSVRLHTCNTEWWNQYEETTSLLKQDPSASDLATAEELLGDHNERVGQLLQMGEVVTREGHGILEIMESITRRSMEMAQGGRSGPDYTSGLDHVRRVVGEMEHTKKRVEQLAEARKLRLEQFKQLYSCEKDANQVTQWLQDMLQQMASGHGTIGDSPQTVEHLLIEQEKFAENAKKTYKYGCDLLSAALRTRKGCHLDLRPNTIFLGELNGSWEKLSAGMVENRSRLEVAQQFHLLVDEVFSCIMLWTTPIHQLPKSPQAIEERLRDIADNKDTLGQKIDSSIRAGGALLDRLCRPLTTDPIFRSLNESSKRSLAFIRERLEDLERKGVELSPALSQQETLLRDFLTYCEFEQSIEQVLMWLQDKGLKMIQTFSQVGESKSSLQPQMEEFQAFDVSCKEHTHTVERLHSEAPRVESQIKGFKSELGRKTASLHAVWEKFLQRVENRREVLTMATSFYDNITKLQDACSEMESSLRPETVITRGKPYLDDLTPKKKQLAALFGAVVKQGESLADFFRKPPIDSTDPEKSSRIDNQLSTLEVHKSHIEELWYNAWQLAEQGKQKPRQTQQEPFKPLKRPEPIGKPPERKAAGRRESDKYGELEEEAYKHLEWLESECDSFLSKHTQVGDSLELAGKLKSQYEKFQESIEPTCSKLDTVVKQLLALKPKAPPLATPIDRLCEVVRGRVEGRRAAIQDCWEILQMFVTFLTLAEEADSNIQRLDDFLCQPLAKDIAAQDLLDQYRPTAENLRNVYPSSKSLGEKFLEATTKMPSGRPGPRLAIGNASTSVAVAMGELEGKFPDVIERWAERDKELRHTIQWQGFKVHCDQISTWLKDSAEMFLRVDLGSSLETAEDLLMELQEFQIRAKRTADEVASLLTDSDEMLADGHFASAELRDRAWGLRNLHSNFQSRTQSRQKALTDMVSFYQNVEKLDRDMDEAISTCRVQLMEDLPGSLKIASVSTRLTNLQVEAEKLLGGMRPTDFSKKTKVKRTESISATEMSVKTALANLQNKFSQYKSSVETRRISPSPDLRSPKHEVQPVTRKRATTLEARAYREATSPKRKATVTKLTSPPTSPLRKAEEAKPPSPVTSPSHGSQEGPPSSAQKLPEVQLKSSVTSPSRRPRAQSSSVTSRSERSTGHVTLTAGPKRKAAVPEAEPAQDASKAPKPDSKQNVESKPPPSSQSSPKRQSSTKWRGKFKERAAAYLEKANQEGGSEPVTLKTTEKLRRGSEPVSRRFTEKFSREKETGARAAEKPRDSKERDSEQIASTAPKKNSKERGSKRISSKKPPIKKDREPKPPEKQTPAATPKQPSSQEEVAKDVAKEMPKVSTELEVTKPSTEEMNQTTVITSTGRDADADPKKPRRRRLSSSSSYVISPGGDSLPRQRTFTAPTVCRAAIKHTAPIKRISLITINVSSKKHGEEPAATKKVSKTIVVSPTAKKPSGSLGSFVSTGKKSLQTVGKVSSLRGLFDRREETDGGRASSKSPDIRGKSRSKSPSPAPKRFRSPDIAPIEEMMAISRAEKKNDQPLSEPAKKSSKMADSAKPKSPSKVVAVREHELATPLRPSPPRLTPEQAPPRPPSPIAYYLEATSDSSELESDSDSDAINGSYSDASISGEGSGRDEVDNPDIGTGMEKRVLKSLNVVLTELLQSEMAYLRSLEILVTVYLPAFHEEHVPTFLQGRKTSIFANIEEIFRFQRHLYGEMSAREGSVEGICHSFLQSKQTFYCYIPFLKNMARGLKILSQYGGTFFKEKQRMIGDRRSLEDHFLRPKERLVEYDQALRDLIMCAQKEYLHGVGVTREALRVVQGVIRAADNTIAVGNLKGCPFTVDEARMVRMEPFNVYSNLKKKKIRELQVFLHRDYVIFTQAEYSEATETTSYQYIESIQTAGMQLVETYKGRSDKFAIFHGSISSGSKLFVLQPLLRDVVLKQIWTQEIHSVLHGGLQDGSTLVGEEHQPLPASFAKQEQAVREKEGWFGSLKRKRSFKGRDQVSGAVRRKNPLKERDVVGLQRKGSTKDRDAVFRRKDSKKLKRKERGPHDESSSDEAASLPPPAVAKIQLATLASGQFQAPEPEEDEDLYVVVEPFTSDREGFLSVEKGQLVEALDPSGATWLVLTVPMAGELETEGFLPARCLRPIGQAGFAVTTPRTSDGHASSHHSGGPRSASGDPRGSGTSSTRVSGHSGGGRVSGASNGKHPQTSRSHQSEFVSRLVDDVYYSKEEVRGSKGGLPLGFGQAVEVLDISDGRWWYVKTVDPHTGKPLEGMVPSASLVPRPPTPEAETGQQVPKPNNKTTPTTDTEPSKASTNKMVQPSSLFGSGGRGYEPPRSLLLAEPHAILSDLQAQQFLPGKDLESTGQSLPAGGPGAENGSSLPRLAARSFTESQSTAVTEEFSSEPGLSEQSGSGVIYGRSKDRLRLPQTHPPPMLPQQEPLSTSLRSLPASFSPVAPRSLKVYLGYDPMEIPQTTLSQPEIPAIRVEQAEKMEAMEELRKLQEATVGGSSTQLEDFDPVELYIAIADFEASEESNISLAAGQHVQVLDSSRSDWWLVVLTDSHVKGWVPANYLERQVLEGPSSPPPEPFIDETGELQRVMLKGRSPSDIKMNRRQLYKSSFLASPGVSRPEPPSQAQLEGFFSIDRPYVAVTEILAEEAGQLSLVQDQPVSILDSQRDDWWLAKTIPEDNHPPIEGWVPAKKLQPYIREDLTEPLEAEVAMSPGGPPLWVLLADYQATESGMLSVSEGELVEVIDTSRNEWCLVRTASRDLLEGWVPAAYLKPYDMGGYSHPSMLPPRFHPHSSPEDSDTAADITELAPPTCMSPETVLEKYDDEGKRMEAQERRQFALSELVGSERDYVEKLEYCIENYVTALDDPSTPKPLKNLKESLYSNLSQIYRFHKERFLPLLTESQSDPLRLGDAFVECREQLQLYVVYCKNKTDSEGVYREFAGYFEELRSQLKDRLELPDYLILPVQRITKYGLLLQDFHKSSIRAGMDAGNIEAAMEVTRGISSRANNTIHLSMVEGVEPRFGELVLQDVFAIQEAAKAVLKERRVFLFDRALIITKKRRDPDKETYIIKEALMLTDTSMTQDMDPLKKNLIIYDMLSGTKFILRAPKTDVRDTWLEQANQLIRSAKQEAANTLSLSRTRSSSEPIEYIARSPGLNRKFRSSKRKNQTVNARPSPIGGGSKQSSLSPEQFPPGTEYIVMECIVMEGGDDMQLEVGEIVELVRVEGGGSLRVRTLDEHPIEGTVPESYLRRRDGIRGAKLEATPKFTMTPSDMTLMWDTTATISCAFNGYPVPSVTWRKDRETLMPGGRVKITSCATSSVLEIIRLEYEDEAIYTCYITNSMGSDSASMALNMHGPPTQPQKPSVSKVASSSVKLKWPVPDYDGTSPILSYQIELLQEGFEKWQPIVQVIKNSYIVKTLEPNTTYRFRIIAINDLGGSRPSEASEVVSTKGRGWLAASPRPKKKAMALPGEGGKDFTDALFDEPTEEESNPLSPSPQYIRKGSVNSLYEILPEELGRGRFGIVHKCVHRINGLQMAAKYVRLRRKKKTEIRQEVEILLKIRGKSPNIMEFHDAFEKERNLVIVTELVPDGELIERIVTDNNLTEGVAVRYLSQLLSALETIHLLNVAHLDVKPENILLAGVAHPTVKLIDFGTAREIGSDTAPVNASSPEFSAPEVVIQDTPTLASDMWSVGVLAYILLSGSSPFFADNLQAVIERIKEARYDFYADQFEQISQDAKDFISDLLQKSPEYRMNATQALQHTWMKTLSRVAAGSASPWPMARLDVSRLKAFYSRRKWHTMALAIDASTVFGPRSTISLSSTLPSELGEMGEESAPRLWCDGPTQVQTPLSSSVSFRFQVGGLPEPSVVWEHEDRKIASSGRVLIETENGVTTLTITEVVRSDEGQYVCCALNGLGSVVLEAQLIVQDKPGPPSEVNCVMLGSYNSALISWRPPTKNGNASITGYLLERRRIEFDSWEAVSSDIESAAHVVEDLLPGVTYVFRVSAMNEVGMGPHSKPSEPLTITNEPDYDSDSPSFEEVRMKMTSFNFEYSLGAEIGRGSYAVVKQCTEKTTDRVFAAKLIPLTSLEEKTRAMHEFEMLRQLTHPRIVSLEDAFDNSTHVILVMELLSGGNLWTYLVDHAPLREEEASRLTKRLIEGLQFLHESRIIHVNLRPENILLGASCSDLKIAGFGMARYIEVGNKLEQLPDSPGFMAPEVVTLQPLTTAADIWSTGAITYLMLTGKSPFTGRTPKDTISNIVAVRLDTLCEEFQELTPQGKDFVLERALLKNPRRRLSAQQCQRHRWLQTASSNLVPMRRLSHESSLKES